MASLQRTIAFTEEHPVAVRVHDDLRLDVTGVYEVFLDIHLRVLEIGVGLALRAFKTGLEVFLPVHDSQTLAAAAVCSLDGDRITELGGDDTYLGDRAERLECARNSGDACFLRNPAR